LTLADLIPSLRTSCCARLERGIWPDSAEDRPMNDRALNRQETGFDLVACMQCGAPAEIVERYMLHSTDGPITHATVLGADRHRFMVLVERLASRPAHDREAGRWASR
jgi:hypothetical protein